MEGGAERQAERTLAWRMRASCEEGVTAFDGARSSVVLKTRRGLASGAGAARDGMDINGLGGRLAGDDTALLIMRTNEDAQAFCNEIHTMLK